MTVKKLQKPQSGKTLNRKIKPIKINLQAVSPFEYALHTLDKQILPPTHLCLKQNSS